MNMPPAAEASYFDGVPVQHVADWQEHLRMKRIERECARIASTRPLDRLNRAMPIDWLRGCAQSLEARMIVERVAEVRHG